MLNFIDTAAAGDPYPFIYLLNIFRFIGWINGPPLDQT